MLIADFSEAQSRFIVPISEGGHAFVPPPLPPPVDRGAIAGALAGASDALGELRGSARLIPDPAMLIRPLQRREALTSSAMEGTITTLAAMLLEEADEKPPADDNAREAFNYVRAMNGALEDMQTLPLSHRVIRGAHGNLLRGLSPARGARKSPGDYRTSQNAVGRAGDTIADARYVPPPPAEMLRAMDSLEAFINRERHDTASRLIDMALAHYQFEAIHPFDDGNGRIGRLLVTLMAVQTGLMSLPLLHISPRIERSKDEYIDRLFRVSTQADWTGWINYFLAVVEASARDAIDMCSDILNLRDSLRQRARDAGKSARLPMIVDAMFRRAWITVSDAGELCRVTFPTAQKDLQVLADAGLLRTIKGGRSTYYVAHDVIALSNRR